jgi:hypothetical protein
LEVVSVSLVPVKEVKELLSLLQPERARDNPSKITATTIPVRYFILIGFLLWSFLNPWHKFS